MREPPVLPSRTLRGIALAQRYVATVPSGNRCMSQLCAGSHPLCLDGRHCCGMRTDPVCPPCEMVVRCSLQTHVIEPDRIARRQDNDGRRAHPRCCTVVCHDAATFRPPWAGARWCFLRYVTLEKPLVTDVLSPMFSILDACRQAGLATSRIGRAKPWVGVCESSSEPARSWQISFADEPQADPAHHELLQLCNLLGDDHRARCDH